RRGRHDHRALPVQPGLHPVRFRLRLRDRLGAVPDRRGVRRDQLAPGLRARRQRAAASLPDHEEGGATMTALAPVPRTDTSAGTGAGPERPMNAHYVARGRIARVITHVCVVIGVLLSVFPFYWLVVMSTSTTAEIFGFPPKLTPGTSFVEKVNHVLTLGDQLQAPKQTHIVSASCR